MTPSPCVHASVAAYAVQALPTKPMTNRNQINPVPVAPIHISLQYLPNTQPFSPCAHAGVAASAVPAWPASPASSAPALRPAAHAYCATHESTRCASPCPRTSCSGWRGRGSPGE